MLINPLITSYLTVKLLVILGANFKVGYGPTTSCLLEHDRVSLQRLFARGDFWRRGRATSDNPLRSSNLSACPPGLARALAYYAPNLSDGPSSRASHPARNSTSSAPRYACRPAGLTSRSTPGPSCFPLRSWHCLLLKKSPSFSCAVLAGVPTTDFRKPCPAKWES